MSSLIKNINNTFYIFFKNTILFYQKIVSPIIPARCRYYPTCSNYGIQALAWHGVWSGSWLLLKRIARCHPLGGHGIDFVPLPLASYHYQYLLSDSPKLGRSQGIGIYRDNQSYVACLNILMSAS
ncbi:membrane protein insertion efficiency factor YidD [uncultured Psychrobacter sp.]|uniref:membrane protein insertion efficiency factor YidD n=1 Tax=uncultured Psychrobacter sp. TaxID=259303 RepID=UPI0034581DE1